MEELAILFESRRQFGSHDLWYGVFQVHPRESEKLDLKKASLACLDHASLLIRVAFPNPKDLIEVTSEFERSIKDLIPKCRDPETVALTFRIPQKN